MNGYLNVVPMLASVEDKFDQMMFCVLPQAEGLKV